jgi:signal transduction histidine kinase
VTRLAGVLALLSVLAGAAEIRAADVDQPYQFEETRALVALVDDATDLVRTKGEAAFADFRTDGSRWRHGEAYVFVLDPKGDMLVHPDPQMEGKSELDLKDVDGKPIIRGLIGAATALPGKPDGWYHYRWPVPGEILPRWKSSYVRRVTAPSGRTYVVGSGMYDDRMERRFVVDAVEDAVGQIEKRGKAAFPLLRDPAGRFIAKDAYVFVYDVNGVDLVNPAFPNLEGRNLLDLEDTQGKRLIREMLQVVRTSGSGWVDYMWPKPGESVSTRKSAYVSKATLGDGWVLVGSGVYLADAPKAAEVDKRPTAAELMALVRDGAALLEKNGEAAYQELRERGSRWFHDETYLFVLTADGTADFHAADSRREGRNDSGLKDVLGRPFVRMFLDTAAGPTGEGWVHYMYPRPDGVFPTWKSAFVKRVTFPSGRPYVVGCGIYEMRMDALFIEDVVNRAGALIEREGKKAFARLRDKTGPFVFMDVYVFVTSPEGTELVNAGLPSLEGRNLMHLKDLKGNAVVEEEIAAAMKEGSAWLEMYWYKPGTNVPVPKRTYVRKVQSGGRTYIVGSGFYIER